MFFYSSWHAIVGVLHQQLFYSFLITYFLNKHGAFTYHVVGEELQQRRNKPMYELSSSTVP
jgi:hypothetical protein